MIFTDSHFKRFVSLPLSMIMDHDHDLLEVTHFTRNFWGTELKLFKEIKWKSVTFKCQVYIIKCSVYIITFQVYVVKWRFRPIHCRKCSERPLPAIPYSKCRRWVLLTTRKGRFVSVLDKNKIQQFIFYAVFAGLVFKFHQTFRAFRATAFRTIWLGTFFLDIQVCAS